MAAARRTWIKTWNNHGSDACWNSFFAKVTKAKRWEDSSEKSPIKEKLADFKFKIQRAFNETRTLQQQVELLERQIQQYSQPLNPYQGDASEKYGQINTSYEDLMGLLGHVSQGIGEVTDQLSQRYSEIWLIQQKPIRETSIESQIGCVEYFVQKGIEDAKRGLKSVEDKLKHLEASFEEFKKNQLRISFVEQVRKMDADCLKKFNLLANRINANRGDLEFLASKSLSDSSQAIVLVDEQAKRLELIKTNREGLKEKRNACQQAFEKNENIEQATRDFQKSADEFSDLLEKCCKEERETRIGHVRLRGYMKKKKINRPPIQNT